MKYYLFFFLILSAYILPQNITIKGEVRDSIQNFSLPRTTVMLFHLPDSTQKGVITDDDGNFAFTNLKSGRYVLSIKYIGYKDYNLPLMVKSSVNLKSILLSPEGVTTEQIEVIGKIPPVIQKADTSEFNADAFKINKNANTDELVQKLPGVTLQDGKVTAQGEEIKKILVNGKPFFGDDPNAVLKNLPADVVDKIQVYDQGSEQSQLTGFNDGNTSKTLNIVTRGRLNFGQFGRFTAGYGKEDVTDNNIWRISGSYNNFNGDQKISVLGQSNNTNEQNFSGEDLFGLSSGGNQFGRGRRMMGPGGPGGGPGGNGFFVNNSGGRTKTNAIALNYSNKWNDKLEISGSYFFNNGNTEANSDLLRTYLNSLADQSYNENSYSLTKNMNNRFNMRLTYGIDTNNVLLFIPRISFQKNDQYSSSFGETNIKGEKANTVSGISNSNLQGLSTSSELLYTHKFELPGRTISLDLNGSYNKNTGDGTYNSELIYLGQSAKDSVFDQRYDQNKNGYSGSANITYTEPFGTFSLVQLSATQSYSQNKNVITTYTREADSNYYMDAGLSNQNEKKYYTQTYSIGYQLRLDKSNAQFTLGYNIATLSNDIIYPSVFNIKKTFTSLLPSAQIRWVFSKDQNLRLNYNASNNSPSIDQMQNVLNNSNPVQLSIGNVNLVQDKTHNLNLRYMYSDIESMQSFFIGSMMSLKDNYVGNNIIIASRDTLVLNNISLKRGSQLTTYDNLNGYINLRAFGAYSIQVIGLNTNLMLGTSYSRTPSKLNGILNINRNNAYNLGLTISSNISEKLDFTVSNMYTYTKTLSSSSESSNNKYSTNTTSIRFFWQIWEGFLIQSDANYQYNSGYSSSYNKNSLVMNASLGKKLFANDQGEIRFTVFDLFNQKTNISRNTTDNYYEDTKSNTLGRYYMLSFIYNLKIFGGK